MRHLAKVGIVLLVLVTFAGFFGTWFENISQVQPERVNFSRYKGNRAPMTNRFELFASNPFRLARFYEEILGFQVVDEIPQPNGGTYIALQNGFTQIGILSASELIGRFPMGLLKYFRSPPIGTEIVLEVDDLGAVYNRVVSASYPIQARVSVQPWGLRDFRMFDPDWYYLRITERRRAKDPNEVAATSPSVPLR